MHLTSATTCAMLKVQCRKPKSAKAWTMSQFKLWQATSWSMILVVVVVVVVLVVEELSFLHAYQPFLSQCSSYRTLQCCKLSYHAMLPFVLHWATLLNVLCRKDEGTPLPLLIRAFTCRSKSMHTSEGVECRLLNLELLHVLRWNCLSQTSVCPSICHASFKLKPVAWTRKWLQRRPALETHSSLGESELSGKFPCNFLRDSDHHWQSPPHWSSNDHHSVQAETKAQAKTTSRRQNFPVIPHSHLYI